MSLTRTNATRIEASLLAGVAVGSREARFTGAADDASH
jgi:hypothetical protein